MSENDTYVRIPPEKPKSPVREKTAPPLNLRQRAKVPVVKHRRRTLLSYLKCRAVAWIALLVMLALVVGIFIASTQGAVSLPSGVKVPHPK